MGAKFAYVLDNAHAIAEQRMSALAALYDESTRRALERTGLATGWRCLEIGGGGGSIARWLADKVGESGHVLCTDLDTRYLAGIRSGTAGSTGAGAFGGGFVGGGGPGVFIGGGAGGGERVIIRN